MSIYCGAKKLTGSLKNRKFGSMKECAEAGKIMRWGLFKADTRIIEAGSITKKNKMTLDKIRIKNVTLKARVKRLTNELASLKDKDVAKKKEVKTALNEAEKELASVKIIYSKLLKEKQNKNFDKEIEIKKKSKKETTQKNTKSKKETTQKNTESKKETTKKKSDLKKETKSSKKK